MSIIADGLMASKSFKNTLACPLYAMSSANTLAEGEDKDLPSGEYIHSVEKYVNFLKYAYMTISFS